MKNLLILLVAILGGSSLAMSQNQNNKVVLTDSDGWHRIGETYVDFTRDRDEVIVLGADRFAKLKFKVTEAPIHLMSLEIFYEDGTSKVEKLEMLMKQDSESPVIDLKGYESNIKKVVFVYHSVGDMKGQKAHVELWGMKTNVDKKK